ncbi:MAG: nucleotide pyrophosphohydrolase [Chloroflexi bacterium]|nr:nucleotide pyrophosphohydrolase [Chloroflexota bacterium]
MNWQQQAAEFAKKQNLTHTPGVYALDLMSEVGEVAKEILLATEYGERPFAPRANLTGELGDALYSLCLLATAVGVDLDEALTITLEKYATRRQTTGHVGSSTS